MKVNWHLVTGFAVLFFTIFRISMFIIGGIVALYNDIGEDVCMSSGDFLLTVAYNMILGIIGFFYGIETIRKWRNEKNGKKEK